MKPRNTKALERAWVDTSSGLLFDIAWAALARSPLKKKVSIHHYRNLLDDINNTLKAMGYEVRRRYEMDHAYRAEVRQIIATLAERYGRPVAAEAALTRDLYTLLAATLAGGAR